MELESASALASVWALGLVSASVWVWGLEWA